MTISRAQRPVLLALRKQHFLAFAGGSKTVEWRAWGPRWNDKAIRPGRAIALSKGYSGARLHGVVVKVERVERDDAPEGARAIYPEAATFCMLTIRVERAMAAA